MVESMRISQFQYAIWKVQRNEHATFEARTTLKRTVEYSNIIIASTLPTTLSIRRGVLLLASTTSNSRSLIITILK